MPPDLIEKGVPAQKKVFFPAWCEKFAHQ
jgi:hypothetical protein